MSDLYGAGRIAPIPAPDDFGAAELARARARRPLTDVRNACGHWSGYVPVRHHECRHLPLTQCARRTVARGKD